MTQQRIGRLRATLQAIAKTYDDAELRQQALEALLQDDAAANSDPYPNPNELASSPYHFTPVLAFHRAYGHPVAWVPTTPAIEQRLLRVKLIAEELTEFADACNVCLEVRPCDEGGYHIEVVQNSAIDTTDLVEAADALGDLRYVVDGGNLIFGFPGERILAEIHASNMSKLGADGRPITREDGKTLKGPNFRPPNITSLLGYSDAPTVSGQAAETHPCAVNARTDVLDLLDEATDEASALGRRNLVEIIAAARNWIAGTQYATYALAADGQEGGHA
jgi:predicted HAD superfamily Cof-like phosphohydrolase